MSALKDFTAVLQTKNLEMHIIGTGNKRTYYFVFLVDKW